MALTDIFARPVDRRIEGVIKADDRTGLQTEINEYVLTQEVEKRLETFFDAYMDYQGANGVWISGFFGSGKSHLLKMLSYLLESDGADNNHILGSFLQKTEHNTFLNANIKRAVQIPSRSVLFNIDQKADVISKEQFDALLSVFVKVFDEMQGYYGKQGHIAQFERELDRRGLYDDFRKAYERIAGKAWERGREESLLESYNIAQAYAEVADVPASSAENILDKYRKEYRVSIEDFAEMVNDYIERQEKGFRLNFFVDEVGQYIADNVKLMTNLQTIAESLATKCDGRAWLIVTAQEEMDTVVGEMGKQQTNDFSKIQDRFKNRMKLTSADVAEVIQKRLLAKNDRGRERLYDLYDEEQNNFNTLFDFADGTDRFKNRFRDADHFVNSYPFLPYQFDLFQAAIQNLSQYSAFEGKHSSVGERSMLAVFQAVAVTIGDREIGQLATFDLMFEGIRRSLKTSIQQAILNAEKQLDNQFAVRVLKVLFLVKYVREFNASEYNISVLMTESFDQDIAELRSHVKEALNILEQQTYIQRNGDFYEYLTNEEKDIEQEIKNTDVSEGKMLEELGAAVFEHVIGETKIGYGDMPQDYPFTRRLDDEPFRSRTYELSINVITPYHTHVDNREVLISRRMGEDELLIILPPEVRLMRDLELYVQTAKYVNQNYTGNMSETRNSILRDKQKQNNLRKEAIQEAVYDLMLKADYLVGGTELHLNGSDPKARVINGFHQLIRSTYTNLKMLGDRIYREGDIPEYLQRNSDMFGTIDMNEAEREIYNRINLQHNHAQRLTLSRLLDMFESKPYGWYRAAILCNLAKLHARGKVEVRYDSNILEGQKLADELVNSHHYANLLLRPEEDYSPKQIRDLKEFFNEFFGEPPGEEDAKPLAQLTREALQDAAAELQSYVRQQNSYPFTRQLEPVVNDIQQVMNKQTSFYLNEFLDNGYSEQLLDHKDNVIAPFLIFWGDGQGAQKRIYDDARDFLSEQKSNLETVGYDEALQIRETLNDETCYRGSAMRRVKNQMDDLKERIETRLNEARAEARERIETQRDRLKNDERFSKLDKSQQREILTTFDETLEQIERYSTISIILQHAQRFEDETWPQILQQVDAYLQPAPQPGDSDEETVVVQPQYIRKKDIRVPFDKLTLEDEADVEAYMQKLKDAYMNEIRDGKRIQL